MILILITAILMIPALVVIVASMVVKRSLEKIEKEFDDEKNYTEHIESID